MSSSKSRRSRVFSISFPEDLARQVDRLARQESRNISELLREAFRNYRLQTIHRQLESGRMAARVRRPQSQYEEGDVERLVDEIRSTLIRRKRR